MPLLSPEVAGYIVVGLLIVWLALGVHIGVALGLAGFLGIYLTVGTGRGRSRRLAAIPFSTTNSFTLAVIPLFILMGSFATVAGISRNSSARRTSGSATCGAGSRWRPSWPRPRSARRRARRS